MSDSFEFRFKVYGICVLEHHKGLNISEFVVSTMNSFTRSYKGEDCCMEFANAEICVDKTCVKTGKLCTLAIISHILHFAEIP